MKGSLLTICTILSFSTVANAQQKKDVVMPAVKLETKEDSIQYALGTYMGNYLLRGGFSSINLELFLAGLNDVYRSKPRLMKDSLAYAMLSAYQDETSIQRSKYLEEQMFLALKDKPNVGRLPSGVQFIVIKPGKGPKPSDTDTVVIHYKGSLPGGEIFENTYPASPLTAVVGKLVTGLSEAVQLMQAGATYQVFVPSALAFGSKGAANIPPNSALMVTIELLEIKRRL